MRCRLVPVAEDTPLCSGCATASAAAADERPTPADLPAECGNCGRMLFASPGKWILCTCETQTTVLP
ncbi:MAG: hypothetical protein PVS2B1_17090 [Candidatus Dormibacteraceae bacterium]